jgi:hypothetical protein
MNLTEKEELKKNFYQIYNEKVLPTLSQLEFHRKRLLKTLDNFTYTHMLKKECLPVLLDCFDFIQYGKYPHYSIYNYRMFSKSYSQGNILSSFFEAHKIAFG